MQYILHGDPLPLVKKNSPRVYDSLSHTKTFYAISLTTQHGDNPLLEGPLHVDVQFYFPILPKQSIPESSLYFNPPSLSGLLAFIEEVTHHIIYTSKSSIASINAQKLYSKDPKTILTFTPLTNKENSRGKNKEKNTA